jgi:hypothetical protein
MAQDGTWGDELTLVSERHLGGRADTGEARGGVGLGLNRELACTVACEVGGAPSTKLRTRERGASCGSKPARTAPSPN